MFPESRRSAHLSLETSASDSHSTIPVDESLMVTAYVDAVSSQLVKVQSSNESMVPVALSPNPSYRSTCLRITF